MLSIVLQFQAYTFNNGTCKDSVSDELYINLVVTVLEIVELLQGTGTLEYWSISWKWSVPLEKQKIKLVAGLYLKLTF